MDLRIRGWGIVFFCGLIFYAVMFVSLPAAFAAEDESVDLSINESLGEEDWVDPFEDEYNDASENVQESLWVDPLEPVNRAFFYFNDKFYFWLLKPVSQGYAFVMPQVGRVGISNVFRNLMMPVRFANSFLQGELVDSGVELTRFLVNSTVGIVGFFDPAKDWLGLEESQEDFGQTLGLYGVGDAVYFCWPILGPSNLRDTIGLSGDYFLNPISYLALSEPLAGYGAESVKRINKTSLNIGKYETIKEDSFDPYIAVRDVYLQYRRGKITE
ncbi:MAG: VacJ family lipoprotein [Proteobacteria bacterium]|nr:VacJ family lipoprotein [Pseudomonadota bacterium]MBU1710117.1 VacJ family lipoprotein [Pseudomonadota bacterium]